MTLRTLPWPVLRLGAWFIPTWAALMEMRYQWRTPHALADLGLTVLARPQVRRPAALA